MTSIMEFDIQTQRRVEFLDITKEVLQAVRESGIQDGICVIHIPHTTAGVTINENADPDVMRDIEKQLARIIPATGDYRHLEGNSDAHIKSSLFNPTLTVIVSKGKLVLGTWQGIYFCEFDGPRTRKYYIKCVAG